MDDDSVEADEDFEAEMNAVISIRKEKLSQSTDLPQESSKVTYNKSGIIQSLEASGTESLPFIETLQICEFDLDVQNQHDDLEREVIIHILIIPVL